MSDEELAKRIYIKLIEGRRESMTVELCEELREQAWMAVRVFNGESK